MLCVVAIDPFLQTVHLVLIGVGFAWKFQTQVNVIITIFGGKNLPFFLKNQCYDLIFEKTSSILNTKPQYFRKKVFWNHNIGPKSIKVESQIWITQWHERLMTKKVETESWIQCQCERA
jgi:hypothetical protein